MTERCRAAAKRARDRPPVATALLGRSVSDVSDARRQARVGQAQVDVAIDVVAGGRAACSRLRQG